MSDTTYKSKVGYKPPVELDYHDGMPEIKSVLDNVRDAECKIMDQVEEHIVAQCSVAVGVKIDRDELIKALKYDRGQYEKGYADGKRDAMEALQVEQEKTVTQIFGEEQQEWEEYCTGLMNRIRELKEQLPKWGEWVEENRRPRSSQFVCSECHRTAYDPQPTRDKAWTKRCRYQFCPNCGAKMEVQDA